MSDNRIIVVHADRCVACKTCELACAVTHSKSPDVIAAAAETPRPKSRVTVEKGRTFNIPLHCRQCAHAACVEICPADALKRDDPGGPVIVDHEACTKCGFCTLACPYGMVRMDEEGRLILKCDQCYDRVRSGELPACVEACPTGALEYVTAEVDEHGDYLVVIDTKRNGDSA